MFPNNGRWHLGTSCIWNGLGALWIFAWSSNGGWMSTMTGHGNPWTKLKLASTKDASGSQCLWCVYAVAVLARCSHNVGWKQVISTKAFSRALDVMWKHTLFASKMIKHNTTNEAPIVLHIKRDASDCISCILVRASHSIWHFARKIIFHMSEFHEQWQQNE